MLPTFKSCYKCLLAFIFLFSLNTHSNACDGEINASVIRAASERLYVSSNTQPFIGVFNILDRDPTCAMQFASVANDADGIHYDEDADVLYQLNRTDNVINAYSDVIASLRQGIAPQVSATSTSDFSNGREIAVSGNKLVVAQDDNGSNGGNRLIVYNISPTSITLESSFAVGFNLWGIHASDQTLYAVVDNSNQLAVFQNFFARTSSTATPDMIVSIEGIVRTHGLTFNARLNQMIMTDVGSGADPSDGAVVLIPDFTRAAFDGVVSSSEQIRFAGSNTFLGNPVDVAYVEKDAMIYVAERANGGGRVLGFRFPPTQGQAGNKAPVYNELYGGASAITLGNQEDEVENNGRLNKRIYISSNTAGAVGVYNIQSDHNNFLSTFPVRGQDADGIAYIPMSDKLFQVNRSDSSVDVYGGVNLSSSNDFDPSVVASAPFSVFNGRGIAVSGNKVVAAQDANGSNGGNRFIVYDASNNNLRRTKTLDVNINLWGVDLDGETLFAVVDNSNRVAIFEDFCKNTATGTGASATQTVSVTDLVRTHGITYVAARDMMLLTDVGAAGSATDGAFIVIRNFTQAAADGRITRNEQIRIAGSSTFLGNPVDIDYCPMDNRVYIAERANGGGRLLAFMLPMMGSSGGNVSPVINVSFPGASSVAIGRSTMMMNGGGNDLTVDNTNTTIQPSDAELDWNVYPNPVVDQVNVKWLQEVGTERMTILVTNTTGQEVSRQMVEAVEGINTYTVNVANLPTGMYRLTIKNAEGVVTKAFVKR